VHWHLFSMRKVLIELLTYLSSLIGVRISLCNKGRWQCAHALSMIFGFSFFHMLKFEKL
jgi:hypothetical protein